MDNTGRIISTLSGDMRPFAEYLVNAFREAGWPIILTSGRRSSAKQAALIRAGYTTATKSRHLTGDAFDFGFYGYRNSQLPSWVFETVGQFGEQLGLRWGGRFNDPDPIHFDLG